MARDRCIFVQCPVRPDFIVIARVRFRILAQRHLAQDNDAIARLMPDRSDQAFGNAIKPKLKKFAVDTWRAPKRIFGAHPPDQYAQLYLDLRSPSQGARFRTPVAAKAGPMPMHERLGPDGLMATSDTAG
jgi:hypothetical protein